MKRQLITIAIVLTTAILFITLFLNYYTRDFKSGNGFNRKFAPLKAQLQANIFLENEDYTFLELTPKAITFYKYRKPNELLTISTDLKKIHKYILVAPSKINRPTGMNSVAVVGSDKFIIAGKSRKSYRISMNKPFLDSTSLDSIPFAQSLTLTANSFLITRRTPYQGSARRDLVVVNWEGKRKHSYMPEKQIDGYFCTDGQFRYERHSKQLIFMFYYRGEFICLDTNLRIHYKAKTIDTVKLANISLKNNVGGLTVYEKPPHLVNKRTCVSGNRIYIQSNLKADNESSNDFDRSEVIDVYNIHNGKYLYSFHIPFLYKNKLYDFNICNDILVATYKNAVAVYKVPSAI